MKKIFAVLGLVAATGVAANAQGPAPHHRHHEARFAKKEMSFKPLAGDVTAELGLTGGILNSDINLTENGMLKFRYFIKDHLAIRLGATINAGSEKTNVYSTLTNAEGYVKENNFGLGINLGIEKHFEGTKRLSPYVGADILFVTNSNSMNGTDATAAFTYNNGYSFETNGGGNFGFGARGVIGADYYFAKNVYLGVEAGIGFLATKDTEKTTTFTNNNVTTTVTNKSAGNNFDLGTNVVTGVRLGFVF